MNESPVSSEPDGQDFDSIQADVDVGVGKSSLLPDPRYLWIIFWRRIWVFLLVTGLVVGAVAAYVIFTPKRYTAVSSVLIEPNRSDPVASATRPTEQAPTSDFIDTQIIVLASPQVATKVARQLNLTESPEFGVPALDESFSQDPAVRTAAQSARIEATGRNLKNAVTMRRVGQTAVIQIDAQSLSPTLAARIANEFATQYMDTVTGAKEGRESLTSAQIDSKLDILRRQSEEADRNLQQYKIANGLMSSQGATMAEQETSTLNQQIAIARSTLAERIGRLAAARRQLQRGGGGDDVTSALSSGTIGGLRQSEAEATRTLAELRAKYGDRHPDIAQATERLADIRRQIQLEIDRILSSLEGEVNIARSGLSSLENSQARSEARLAGNASAQVGFMQLQSRSDTARTVYETFLKSSRDTAARNGIIEPTVSVASAAVVPTLPSSPNARVAYILGSVFALAAGILAVILVELLDGGVRTKTDVERRLGARYLGVVPELSSTLDGLRSIEEAQDYIVTHPLSTFAEALRSLRTAALLRGTRRPKVLAITSALPREGKTTTAVCLARTLAMSGASTVLLDCDLRRHSASDMLLGDRPGLLMNVLAGALSIDDALLVDTETELFILGTSEGPRDGRDLLAPAIVGPLLAKLRERFDYIVIDTAPVLGIADARAVASQADVVLLLARWRQTSLRAADSALDLLIDSKAKVAGVALTMVDIRKYASTGHEDIYGYHKQFKGYYVN